MAECARLESGYTARYRGFESLPLRKIMSEVNIFYARGATRLRVLREDSKAGAMREFVEVKRRQSERREAGS